MGLLEDLFEAVKEGVIVSRTMRRHSHDVEVAEFGKSLSHLKVKTPPQSLIRDHTPVQISSLAISHPQSRQSLDSHSLILNVEIFNLEPGFIRACRQVAARP